MASDSGEFYEAFNNNGQLIKASKRFGYMREVTLRLYDNGKLWVHLNDNSKCLGEEKKFDISKSKSISVYYDDIADMMSVLEQLEPYKRRMLGEHMMVSYISI